MAAASSARCAVTKVRRDASLRKVSGSPASAAHPSAAVMPGTTIDRHAGLTQMLEFLAAAAEYEGIAALEAHDMLAGAARPRRDGG